MFSLLRVSIFTAVTAHVWAQSGNIYSVTSQVLGLSENDFKQNDNKELFDLMSKEDQRRYRELEQEGGEAYSFIVELWTRAMDAATGRLDKQTAFQKVSHFHDIMPDREKRRLLHYFPTVANALAAPSNPGRENDAIKFSGATTQEKERLEKAMEYITRVAKSLSLTNDAILLKSLIHSIKAREPNTWTVDDLYPLLIHFSVFSNNVAAKGEDKLKTGTGQQFLEACDRLWHILNTVSPEKAEVVKENFIAARDKANKNWAEVVRGVSSSIGSILPRKYKISK